MSFELEYSKDWTKEFGEADPSTQGTQDRINKVINEIRESMLGVDYSTGLTVLCDYNLYTLLKSYFRFKDKRQWREVRNTFGQDKAKWKELRGY